MNGTHIFWANSNPGGTSIGRANLDGSNVNPNFITGATAPGGVAVTATHVYWTNNSPTIGEDSIGRANLDGSGVNQDFISVMPDANLFEVAVNATHIFWGNSFTIGRANVNGTRAKTGLPQPRHRRACGPARAELDPPLLDFDREQRQRGTYGPAGFVGRANLNGTGIVPHFIPANTGSGVALFGGSIYWGNFGQTINVSNTIGRANVDGTGVNQALVPKANFPNGVDVDAGGAPVFGKLKCKGGCKVKLHVPMGGLVTLRGKGIKARSKSVGGAADFKLKVTPKGKLKRGLENRGKASTKLSVTLAPVGIPAGTSTAKLVLRG